MSASDQCRATAARYERLAALTNDAQVRRSYLELAGLWLETAGWTERLNLQEHESARRRIYELIDPTGSRILQVRAQMH